MKFSRQEYWSGLPFPSPGDLPDPGIKPGSPAWQADSLPSEPPGKSPLVIHYFIKKLPPILAAWEKQTLTISQGFWGTVKNLPAMQETRVWSLGQEDPLEKEMAAHSSTLARRIPWTEEPGRLQSLGSLRVGRESGTKTLRVRNPGRALLGGSGSGHPSRPQSRCWPAPRCLRLGCPGRREQPIRVGRSRFQSPLGPSAPRDLCEGTSLLCAVSPDAQGGGGRGETQQASALVLSAGGLKQRAFCTGPGPESPGFLGSEDPGLVCAASPW